MEKNMGIFRLLSLFFCCLFLYAPECRAEDKKTLFRIGTGGKTGVYYPVGKFIAQGLTGTNTSEHGIPGLIGVAQNSAGSVENVRTLIAGEIEAGLVQADIAAQAFQATGHFAGKTAFRDVRAIACLYPEEFHIVTRADAGIRTVTDLKKKRISLDEPGSGTLAVMQIILDAHKMSEKDLDPIYLKPVFTEDQIISGELKGFVMMAGAPMDAVTRLLSTGIFLVPVSRNIAETIHQRYPYLVPGTIPATVYPGIPDTPTLQVYALLLVHKDMKETLAYRITRSLWSDNTRDLLTQGHPKGEAIRLEQALTGLSVALHDGARRFYKENGMTVQKALLE